MKITLLGTSACTPQLSRANTSVLVEHERIFLVDCGGETPRQIIKAGYGLNDVDVILISHFHGDHLSGISVMLKSLELSGRRKKLTIYGPSNVEKVIRSLMDISFPGFFTELPFALEFVEISESKLDDDLFASGARHGAETYSFRIGDVTYSADTAPYDELVELARGSEILIHDSSVASPLERAANEHGHSSARQAGVVAKSARVRELVLVHIESTYEGKEDELLRDASKEFDGEISVGRDFMVLETG